MPVNAIIALVVLLICIVVGFKTKINLGLICIAGAFVVGTLVMGMKPNNVLTLWNVSLFITLFSITMFFGITTSNGTLKKLSEYIIYPFRNHPWALPFVLYLVAVFVSFIGPGAIAATAMLAPIYMTICREVKMKYIMIPICLSGCSGGAWGPIALNGQLTRSNLLAAGFAAETVDGIANRMFFALFIFTALLVIIGYFVTGSFKLKKLEMEKPAGFDPVQKKTLLLMGILIFFIGVVPVLGVFIKASWYATFSGWFHIYMMCCLLSIVAVFMKITDVKGLISNVRWDTIIMLGGVSILIALANQAGLTEYLSSVMGSLSDSLMNVSVTGISGVLSFFTSTLVVMPTMMPIINGLVIGSGANAAFLNCCMITAATGAGFSPLSLIGSLVMAGLDKSDTEATQRKLFGQLWLIAILTAIFAIIIAVIGFWNIFC